MTLIRTAAAALAKSESGVDNFDDLDDELQERLLRDVRSVLIAVRDQAGQLANAGEKAAADRVLDVSTRDAQVIFAAMLDAALFDNAP